MSSSMSDPGPLAPTALRSEFVVVLADGVPVGSRSHAIRRWWRRSGSWATYCGRISCWTLGAHNSVSFVPASAGELSCRRCQQCLAAEDLRCEAGR